MYNADKNSIRPDIINHATMPYVETDRNLTQEHDFATFLDKNSESIDWWYKNGDQGQIHYAIEYFNPRYEEKRLFYVDFIIRLKNGDIYLFDTKGSEADGNMEPDDVLVAKHNALNEYVSKSTDPHLKAGSLIRRHDDDPDIWKYCNTTIHTPEIQPTWLTFFPDQLNVPDKSPETTL